MHHEKILHHIVKLHFASRNQDPVIIKRLTINLHHYKSSMLMFYFYLPYGYECWNSTKDTERIRNTLEGKSLRKEQRIQWDEFLAGAMIHRRSFMTCYFQSHPEKDRSNWNPASFRMKLEHLL